MIKKLAGCFSDLPVNMGRQSEIDIAKGICVILMVFTHSFENVAWFFDPGVSSELSDYIFNSVIGNSFGATLFMLCMGISLCYSKSNSPKDMAIRGVKLAAMGFLLETLRTGIPGLIEWLMYRDPECIEYVGFFFAADIFQFAALAFFILALFTKLKLSVESMLMISAVAAFGGQLLQGLSTGSYAADLALGYIYHSHESSYFPLLNWLIFPIIGYAFGRLWLRLRDKETFFKIITPVCLIISIAYYLSMHLLGEWYYFSGGSYWAMGPVDALFTTICGFAVIGIAFLIHSKVGVIAKFLASMGRRITSIYCIHWTIFGFLYLFMLWFLDESYLPQWSVLPVGVIMLVVSDLISRGYIKYKNRTKS